MLIWETEFKNNKKRENHRNSTQITCSKDTEKINHLFEQTKEVNSENLSKTQISEKIQICAH
jgi:hypothetical protein